MKKPKVKIIDGVEHCGNIPRPHGYWLWCFDRCPLWVSIFILFVIIAVEMLGFACLYSLISSFPIKECLDYSLFSALGQTVTASVPNALIINRIISIQSIFTNCTISFYMAIVLYKLMNAKPMLFKIEDHVVFDPTSGTLRLRVANVSRFNITNVRINATFRIHIPDAKRHATAQLQLKRDNINVFRSYAAWNIATKPIEIEDEKDTHLDIKKYDSDRTCKFIPELLLEQYRSDDPEIAKRLDYRNLDVTITVTSPLFGTDWVYHKSFSAKDFLCGKLISLGPDIPGKTVTDWSNWGRYDDWSENYCSKCVFAGCCGIVKKSQRYTLIN